jgi:hypothetical protein
MLCDMATLERGKGKRKQVIEIVRHGDVLCMQETDAGDRRLPGYRRFADEAAAAAALAAEVRERIDAGMLPADPEARAIADAQPPKKSGPPVLPVRRDLGLYNEATGFVVTSRKMAGKTLDDPSPEWRKAVMKGDMLPLMLVQDDPFIIRVVAGGPLSEQEKEEWVARVDWHLNVPDGKLCVTGGSLFTNDDYDEGDAQSEQYVGQVDLPKGRYRAALYTHVHGVNGGSVLDHVAGGYGKGEALESWFARTRAGEDRPGWDDVELVDFLLHLEPIDAAPKTGLSTLPEDGWFGGAENARKPERCPIGLPGHNVVRSFADEVPGNWTYVRGVFEDMPAIDRRPVKGGPVSLPLESLARAVRIAWFGTRFTATELRLTPPAGTSLDLRGAWPEGVVAVDERGVARVLFDSDSDIGTILERLPALAARLAAFPPGTVLEVCCAPTDTMPGSPDGVGLLSLRGPIRDGAWRIAQAYPETDAATLGAALALAAELEGSATIAVRDEAEGHAILAWAKRNFGTHLKDNPPRLADGAIRFKKPGHQVSLLGIAAFATRFGGTWPVTDLAAADDDEDDEGDGLFPTTPIKGAEVFAAPSGRVYHATMAMLVSEKVGADIPKRERPLFGAGFKHVGDVVCSAFENVAIRGYAKPGGNAWAYFRISAPFEIEFEMASTFAGDAVLVTTGTSNDRDDLASNTFRQGVAGASLKDLIARHDRRLAELTATLGAARTVESTLKRLAETVEAVVLKG